MGTIVKRGETHRAIVRLKGFSPVTKSFPTAIEARKWITVTEAALIAYTRHEHTASETMLGWIMKKYLTDIENKKPYVTRSRANYRRWAIEYENVPLSTCTAEWWQTEAIKWDVSPSSRATYLSRAKTAIQAAELHWNVTYNWKEYDKAIKRMANKKLVNRGRARDRRVTDEEASRIKAQIGVAFATVFPLADIIDIALLTGFRQAEICGLKWKDINGSKQRPMIWVRNRKHPREKMGNNDNVPLLNGAMAVIERQPKTSEYIFPYQPASVGNAFRQCAMAAQLKDLRFHDMRHEAVTRLFDRGYGIEEVALISGHKSWDMLKRYTHIHPERLHQGPISHRRAV